MELEGVVEGLRDGKGHEDVNLSGERGVRKFFLFFYFLFFSLFQTRMFFVQLAVLF